MKQWRVIPIAVVLAAVIGGGVRTTAQQAPGGLSAAPPTPARGGAQAGGRTGATPAMVVVPAGKPTVVLWPNGAPGSEARKDEPEQIQGETVLNVHNPSIIVFLPRKEINTGVGMIVAPGGGHTSLWIMHEGFNPAQALADKGIAAFVLKNRLQSSGYKFDVEGLADMQRAIRVVRSRAAEWGVDPAKIGASGFSAGGELAELAALRNDPGNPAAADPIERFSSRPDFQVLIYPGKSQLIQPVPESPPAFMAAGFDDRPDISTGLAEAYLRFKKVGVQAELHMYAKVGHGFGIRPERAGQSHQEWPVQLVSFLHQLGMVK
ncbi:MAG: alpha/beta hydrolase [Acidobacteriota bacterium]